MVMIGDRISLRYLRLPRAGRVDVEEYSESLYLASIRCPICSKHHAPFRNRDRRLVYHGTGYPWCGLDHQDVEQYYSAICPSTRKPYRFELYIPQ
jgi:hypothetical protein